MKRKNLSLVTLLVVLISILTSCKKYEEGPGFSLKTKKSRLVGKYEVTEYTVEGEDHLTYKFAENLNCSSGTVTGYNTYNFSLIYNFKPSGALEVLYSGDYNFIESIDTQTCVLTYYSESGSDIHEGSWEFGEDKETLIIVLDGVTEEYEIIELRDKQIQLFVSPEIGESGIPDNLIGDVYYKMVKA